MDFTDNIIQEFCTIDYYRTRNQSITQAARGVRLECKVLDIVIQCAMHRSPLQNKDVCIQSFKQIFDTLSEFHQQLLKNE